jgi:hypothetical protein
MVDDTNVPKLNLQKHYITLALSNENIQPFSFPLFSLPTKVAQVMKNEDIQSRLRRPIRS